jgi:hypothetical protein
MFWWLNPWAAVVEARHEAERFFDHAAALTRENRAMRAELEEARVERARRSASVSRGNRTRALRRRGALLPAPINDFAGHEADPRTSITG